MMIEKYLVKAVKILIGAALFLPLLVSGRFFFPFIVPRELLFRIIIEFCAILYLFLIFYFPQYRPKFNFLTKVICAFFAILLASSIFGVSFDNSVFGDYERMGGLLHLSHIFVYFLLLINVFKEEDDWLNLFTTTIFVSVLMGFIGLAQYFNIPVIIKSGGGIRMTGTIGNAAFFAGYLLLNLFLVFYLFFRRTFKLKLFAFYWIGLDLVMLGYEFFLHYVRKGEGFISTLISYKIFICSFLGFQLIIFLVYYFKNKKKLDLSRYFLGLISIFLIFILYLTQTRGALLALYLVFLLIFLAKIFLVREQEKKLRIFFAAGFIILIALPLLLYFNREANWIKNNSTLNRIATISLNDITTESRLAAWRASWKGMLDKPILGWGVENYKIAFNKYFPAEIFRDQGSQLWFDRAHNIIFDVGITAGFIGLAIYILIYLASFGQARKEYQESKDFSQSYLLFIFLLGYLFQNLFVFDTLNSELLLFLILGFIVYLDLRKNIIEPKKESQPDYNLAVFFILFLIFSAVAYNLNIKTWQGNRLIAKHLLKKAQLKTVEYNQEAVDYIKKSINKSKIGRFEARQQLANFTNDLAKKSAANTLEISELSKYVIQELKNSIKEEPLNIRHQLFLTTVYNATYKFDQTRLNDAINLLTEIIPLSPARPQIYFERGQSYINLGQYDKGITDFKKGVELSPWADESYWNLAAAYILAGEQEEADKIFILLKDRGFSFNSLDNLNKLVNIYGRVKNWQKVVETLQNLVALDPDNGGYHARLAAGYKELGDKENAKKEVLKAMELDPSLKEEGAIFLEYLKNN